MSICEHWVTLPAGSDSTGHVAARLDHPDVSSFGFDAPPTSYAASTNALDRQWPNAFQPSTNRRMYRLLSKGEIGPLGCPRPSSRLRVVRCFWPCSSSSSTAASSHILIRCSIAPSKIRRARLRISSACGILSKYPLRSASTTCPCPVFSRRVDVPTASVCCVRAVGVLLRLQVGLEDRLQDQHRRHLRHAIAYARNA